MQPNFEKTYWPHIIIHKPRNDPRDIKILRPGLIITLLAIAYQSLLVIALANGYIMFISFGLL